MDSVIVHIGFLLIVLLCFFIAGQAIYYRMKGDAVQAVISEIHTTYNNNKKKHDVYVDYVYQDQTFSHVKLGYHQNGFYEGRDIPIYLLPSKPHRPVHGGQIVFGIIGIIVLVVYISFCKG